MQPLLSDSTAKSKQEKLNYTNKKYRDNEEAHEHRWKKNLRKYFVKLCKGLHSCNSTLRTPDTVDRRVKKTAFSVERAQHQHQEYKHEEIVLSLLFAAVGLFDRRDKKIKKETQKRLSSIIHLYLTFTHGQRKKKVLICSSLYFLH